MNGKVIYRRIRGRVVPIREPNAKGASVGDAKTVVRETDTLVMTKKSHVTPHRGLQAAALGTSLMSGVISGLTILGSKKKLFIGQGTSLGLDLASSSLNVASYGKKGKTSDRLKGMARGEAINQIAGYGAFGATVLANPATRKKGFEYAAKGFNAIKNLLKRVR